MKRRSFAALFAALLLTTSLALGGCEALDTFASDFGGFIDAAQQAFDDFMNPISYDEGRQAQITRIAPVVSAPTVVMDGYLTVGIKTLDTLAPSYIANADGTISGFDIDLASAMAEEMGLKVRFVSVYDIGQSLGYTCDIVMDVAAGEDPYATVIGQYAETGTAFFYRGEPVTLGVADFYGKSVALQQGSVSQALLETSGLQMYQSPYNNLNEAFAALDAGVVDFVLCEAYPGAYLASTYEGLSCCGTLDVPSSLGIGVSVYNTELQNAVQNAFTKVSTNGLMNIVRRDWVGGMANLSYANQVQVSTQ